MGWLVLLAHQLHIISLLLLDVLHRLFFALSIYVIEHLEIFEIICYELEILAMTYININQTNSLIKCTFCITTFAWEFYVEIVFTIILQHFGIACNASIPFVKQRLARFSFSLLQFFVFRKFSSFVLFSISLLLFFHWNFSLSGAREGEEKSDKNRDRSQCQYWVFCVFTMLCYEKKKTSAIQQNTII